MSLPITYRDLIAWQRGMDLVEQCYRVTASFPASELYGLTSQVRRAAISIPSNIAEGYCRKSTKGYLNHLSIALGSHGELETCLEIAERLGFLRNNDRITALAVCDSAGQLLSALRRSIERKLAGSRVPEPLGRVRK